MSYIESHQELEGHPKLLDLMVALSLDTDTAIGRLHRFWYWCMTYAESGVLEKHPEARIDAKFGAGFTAAMRECGFIDKDRFRVHDWLDYAGRYLTARYRTRNPLHLAAIYLEYGRRPEAERILANAMQYKTSARVTQEQYDALMGPSSAPAKPETPSDKVLRASQMSIESDSTGPGRGVESDSKALSTPIEQQNARTNPSQPNPSQPSATQPISSPPNPPAGGAGGPETALQVDKVNETATDFPAWWALYPHKVNEKAAKRAWERINPSLDLQIVMINALRQHVEGAVWQKHIAKKTLRFIPQPANWLKDERWKDEVPAPAAAEGKDRIEGPPQGSPYKPTTPLHRVICVYKLLKGIALDDRGWDEANWSGAEPSAVKLLKAFAGDDRAANTWLETYADDLGKIGAKSWTLRSAATKAWDTKGERQQAAAGAEAITDAKGDFNIGGGEA